MAFRVAARTVLELGAELISSDAVAVYELVKNAIDAGSKDGMTIEFCITLRHSDYVDARNRIGELIEEAKDGRRRARELIPQLEELKKTIVTRMVADGPTASRRALIETIEAADSLQALRTVLDDGYVAHNWIEFRDTGHGMSRTDLLTAFLVIGTPSRRRALDDAMKARDRKAPYLGEKGVGRLSAMRLGSRIHVKTATERDKSFNLLEVDWSQFEDLEKLVEEITIEPTAGERKLDPSFSGTTIRIGGLNATWSPQRIQSIATYELARLSDPFSKTKRRFRILILFNGARIDIPRLDTAILELAHARVTGQYVVRDGEPYLEVTMWCGDLGKGNPSEERRLRLERVDLRSIVDDASTEIPASALTSVGPFSFELYWYNRRLLRAVDSIGERKRVLALQAQWSGIMLFRDAYRVFPYGDSEDDWLDLDRKALASSGYKLNKAQFIGRVSISRTANKHLIDQTNREGLKDCDEKQVLVEVLRFVIQDRLKNFIDEVDGRHSSAEIDFEKTEKLVKSLENRAQDSIRELEKRHANEKPQLRELLKLFDEMREYFLAAKQKAEQVADERDRMIQLAGVGLLLEIVAHELARSTESTLRILDEADPARLPSEVASLFSTLRYEMQTMARRLRVLDPLSVSGRQRKETFDFVELVKDILEGHQRQFLRHKIDAELKVVGGAKRVVVHGVRGMFVQIMENLVQNSVYWLELRRRDEPSFRPRIEIKVGAPPEVMEFSDNGPGIPPSQREEVFKAFFSTKGARRRQGLGLYIARDCAEHNGAQLYLSEERREHSGRLNTFILELPRAAK